MHYYAITLINAVNGWVSCRMTIYRKFSDRHGIKRVKQSLQSRHSWVDVRKITHKSYLAQCS